MITDILAIWGASIATFTLGWTIYRDYVNKGRLRVGCYVAESFIEGVGYGGIEGVAWSLTNIGGKPIFVTGIIAKKYKNKNNFFLLQAFHGLNLPLWIEPGNYINGIAELEKFPTDIKSLWVTDSLNRKFHVPRKAVKKLVKDIANSLNS